MTELIKKYIEVANEEKKNYELYKQLINERHQKLFFIRDNENVFGQDLRRELMDTIFEFYDNDEQFKKVQKRLKKASHELNILWQIATDDEKKKIEQYFINRIHELIDKRRK